MAFFVSTERQYRALYDYVRTLNEDQIDYSMDTSRYAGGRNGFLRSLLSITLLLFYPIIIAAAIIAAPLINQ
ncbi:MAG: hypothetical protein NVV59_14875 [Chitinophagaceae bacterium]|nr:hypothetical protein [Chitinophagaceae bacterium]